MVKVSNQAIEGFLDGPLTSIIAVLLYGENTGLVRERADRISAAIVEDPKDPFCVAFLSNGLIKNEPTRLFDEMNALSFTGGRRLVRFEGATNNHSTMISTLLDDPTPYLEGNFLLVEAGMLSPRDSLRKTFEINDLAAAIPCYLDDDKSLENLVNKIIGHYDIPIEPSAMNYLVENLSSDRQVSRSELEKLALYKGNKTGAINLEDAKANIGDGASMARDEVALAAANGDQKNLDRALAKCWFAGESPIAILRSVIRHLERLHLLSLKARKGTNINQLIKFHKPPIFFKHQAQIQQQLMYWRPKRLAQALRILTDAEFDCKTTGLPANAICGRALIRIANAARTTTYR